MKPTYGRVETSSAVIPSSATIVISYVLIAIVALLPRVLDLGGFVTVDEISFWMQRSEMFLRAIQSGNYAATAISTHPGVTTMWLGSAGVLLRRAFFAWGLLHDDSFPTVLMFFRLPVALAHTVGILAGYGLLRRLLPALSALLAALLWALDPFVIAYSRVLHVDALAGTFITLSLLAACVYWFHQPRRRFLIISAVCAGLALLSKSPALALLPMVGLIALVGAGENREPRTENREPRTENREPTTAPFLLVSLSPLLLVSRLRQRSFILPLLAWAIICLATVIALWPALWAGPSRAIEQVRVGVVGEGAEPHMQGNFFMGREDDAPGLLFYPVALALRLTPWTLLGLLLLPLVWRRAREWAPARRDLAMLAVFVLVFILAMSLFPKKFNRYIEPIFPLVDILAAVGLLGIRDWRLTIGRLRHLQLKIGLLVASVVSIAACVNVAYWHPYEIAAFNQALGGARAGENAFQIGWGEGLEQVAAWLNEQPDITGVRVASTQPWALQPYLRDGAQAVPSGEKLPDQTGYVVVYVRSAQAQIWTPFDQFYGRAVPAHVVSIRGIDYAWIYRAPPQVTQERPANFGAAIHLRGLTLEHDARRGEPLALQLVWETRATPPADYMLFAHLIGAGGKHYAQIDLPNPTSQWRSGEYATTELPLAVPADAPAGTYQVVIGLYDPANGQRLALTSDQAIDPALDGPDALPLLELQLR